MFALGLALLSLRLLPLLLGLPRLGWLGRVLLFAVCELFLLSQNLDTLPKLAASHDPLQLAFPLVHELAVGLVLLLLFSTLWASLRAAGRLTGLFPDSDFSLAYGPGHGAGEAGLSLEPVWTLCGTALFFALDGGRQLLAVIAGSYALVPLPGSEHEPTPWHFSPDHLAALGGRLFVLALLLALPVLVPRLLAELWLALATRSLFGARPGLPAALARPVSLRPLLWLLTALLGSTAVLTLWLRQAPPLFQLLRSPLLTP